MNQVAAVDQNAVATFIAGGVDQCGSSGETDGNVLAIGVIVIVDDVHVDVGGFHQAQINGGGGCRRRG